MLVATGSWAQYCTTNLYASWASDCYYNLMYINSVSTTGGMTNISNMNSACGGFTCYTYYSSQTHTTSPGSIVSMSFNNNPYYSCEYIVFVDYNQDGDFTDAGEQVGNTVLSANQTSNVSFTVPTGTSPGTKRLRVRNKYGFSTSPPGTFTACNQESYGETEDYNLTICSPVAVTTPPSDKSVCINTAATYTVQASGTASTYQWQVDDGSGFTNITNTGSYSGANTATLTVNATSNLLKGAKYRVAVGGCGSATSAYANLTVIDSTTINAQTASGNFCDGVNTELNIGTKGTPANSAKWQVDRGTGFVDVPDGFPYMGLYNDTLIITPLADSMNGFVFRCVTSGTCNSDTTDNITIIVDRIPEFVSSPNDILVDQGEDGKFNITAVGKAGFRWQAKTPKGLNYVNLTDNANYSGTLTSELTVKNPSLAQSGYQYRCLLTGLGNCNSVKDTTSSAMLRIRNPLGVANAIAGNSGISLFPNPAKGTDEVSIRVKRTTNLLKVTITDKLGRTVSRNELSVSANTGVLNIGKLAPGHYAITVEDVQNNNTETIKFVKE